MLEIKRIVPSHGCDIRLLQTEGKSILLDTGMFHCSENTIKLIKEELHGRSLDSILISHTHYDHVGGIPALREAYPGIKVYGSEYAEYVLKRNGARKVMHQLAWDALKTYAGEDAILPQYDENSLFIDEILNDGDEISLGDATLKVYETPGHTKCSLTFFEPENRDLFLSESTGVYVDSSWVDVSILSGYEETMHSIRKCAALHAKTLYIPHYGKLEKNTPDEFFELAERSAEAFKNLIFEHWENGCSDEEVMAACRNSIWMTKVKGHEDQPQAAFDANTKAFLNVLKREFFEEYEMLLNPSSQHKLAQELKI
ncbi:MAG: MBL fold metallo-hydrolase [Clostridia bacterium]|nr:MBL fold metallo-hydrolase [Clostridia bacterium]